MTSHNQNVHMTQNRTIILLLWAFCLFYSGSIWSHKAQAQLSPGKLSQPHAHLEGLKKCSQCHKLGSKDLRPKCLDCHQEIAAMRDSGRGLHAHEDFDDCVDCHVDHQGVDFDMIFWPDGQKDFEHQMTGFPLTGSHQSLDCRQCHKAKHISDPGTLLAMDKDLSRTFLGLEPQCQSCHADIHAGQFNTSQFISDCTHCHDTAQWKPAPLFDHANAQFQLTGKHTLVDCAKCHQPQVSTEGGSPVIQYTNLEFQSCTSCHQDPHVGSLGPDCSSCHTTAGWLEVASDSFDHDRTRYPLRGRHRNLECSLCHGVKNEQKQKKPAFAACSDCHQYRHLDNKSDTDASNRWQTCEDCHTVAGFQPSNFTQSRHQGSGFPLQGAHQAVACIDCHQTSNAPTQNFVLALSHTACTDCHQDPHLGQMNKLIPDTEQGCAVCHTPSTWGVDNFDHQLTGFALEGRHQQVACSGCHQPVAGDSLNYSGLKTTCATCHEDVHRGQFSNHSTSDGKQVACEVCHVTEDWFAEKFDHERHSRFPLKGGHERTPCSSCHHPLEDENPRLLKFKPLPVKCQDCHQNSIQDTRNQEGS